MRPLRVFVSSVEGGYEEYRAAAKCAIASLGHVPVLMERPETAASPDSPQTACLGEVESSDIVVLLMGARYGDLQHSGLSATHEEWVRARSIRRKVLVFVEKVDIREPEQQAFVNQVEHWVDGHFRKKFSSPLELSLRIVAALRKREMEIADEDVDLDPVEGLPPTCRRRVEALRRVAPVAARHLINWFSDPACRTGDDLSFLLDHPPEWLTAGGHLAWEAISDYMDAYGIPGSDGPREKAIEAGSPRRYLYLINQAAVAADQDKVEQAKTMLDQVPSDYPLRTAALARIKGDAEAVVNAITSAEEGVFDDPDPDLALSRVMILTWAYMGLGRYNLAAEVLQEANQRFPKHAALLFNHANTVMGMAGQAGWGTPGGRELLTEAVDIAIEARDSFRLWSGPSHHAVALATEALHLLEEPHKVVNLASREPDGAATGTEAKSPKVQQNLAFAYMALGRHADIDDLRIEGIDDPFERAYMRGMRAHAAGDEAAASMLRVALSKARDYPSRRKALWGLAMCGEVDEAALSEVTEADAALFRGIGAFNRGDLPAAINALRRHRLESFFHAVFLAKALEQDGNPEEAVDTLRNAAAQFGEVSLLVSAAEILVEHDRFGAADSMVKDALAQNPSQAERFRITALLVAVAQGLEDWPTAEAYARGVVQESPQNERAAWVVVYALHRQGKNQLAWDYLVRSDLLPFNEDTARLAILLCRLVAATTQDAERLLKIAGMYADSEKIVGAVLMTLMSSGDRVGLDQGQRRRLGELMDDFVGRYPQSDRLRTFSADSPEETLEMLAALQQPVPEEVMSVIEKVRQGFLPYGVLSWVRDLPYAAVLLSMGAGWLTAIPSDATRREREREAARRAMGGSVAVDTSAVVVGVAAEFDLRGLGDEFEAVLVADELTSDARMAVFWAKEPVVSVVGYDSLLERPTVSEIDEAQRQAMVDKAESASETLASWQQVTSGHLPPPTHIDATERLKPWDASLRVAASQDGCALWCDDIALRALAEQEGIPTFGTWALLEALASIPENAWSAPTTDIKMRLLKGQIADVPISLVELHQAIENTEDSHVAVNCFLARPRIWIEGPQHALGWCLNRVQELKAGSQRQQVLGLLYAACYGWGTAVPPLARNAVIGTLLGGAILVVSDPATTPQLLMASRYAANELAPKNPSDPLADAVKNMLNHLENTIGPDRAAQTITLLFSEADAPDRRIVASIVFGDR